MGGAEAVPSQKQLVHYAGINMPCPHTDKPCYTVPQTISNRPCFLEEWRCQFRTLQVDGTPPWRAMVRAVGTAMLKVLDLHSHQRPVPSWLCAVLSTLLWPSSTSKTGSVPVKTLFKITQARNHIITAATMLSRAFFVAALVATAAADAVMRNALAAHNIALQPRQTQKADDAKCTADFNGVYASSPTPPPEIFAYAQVNPLTDWCQYSVPSSLASLYTSYESAVSSWADDHVSQISSLANECPQYSFITVVPTCWHTAGPSPTAAAGSSNGTTTKGSTSAGATGASRSGNAGPRETGMVAAAMAVAGILGAVAAL